MAFSLLVVDTNEDFLIVVHPFCVQCLRAKLHVHMLCQFAMHKCEVQEEMQAHGMRPKRIRCDCLTGAKRE